MRGQLPAGGDHRLDVALVEVRAFRLEVEDPGPAVLAQRRQGEGELGPVAVVEGEHDRLRRQGAAVGTRPPRPVPGSPPRSRARPASPSAGGSRVAADVEFGVGRAFGGRAEDVVLEDRHRAGVRFPVGLRRRVADRARLRRAGGFARRAAGSRRSRGSAPPSRPLPRRVTTTARSPAATAAAIATTAADQPRLAGAGGGARLSCLRRRRSRRSSSRLVGHPRRRSW